MHLEFYVFETDVRSSSPRHALPVPSESHLSSLKSFLDPASLPLPFTPQTMQQPNQETRELPCIGLLPTRNLHILSHLILMTIQQYHFLILQMRKLWLMMGN